MIVASLSCSGERSKTSGAGATAATVDSDATSSSTVDDDGGPTGKASTLGDSSELDEAEETADTPRIDLGLRLDMTPGDDEIPDGQMIPPQCRELVSEAAWMPELDSAVSWSTDIDPRVQIWLSDADDGTEHAWWTIHIPTLPYRKLDGVRRTDVEGLITVYEWWPELGTASWKIQALIDIELFIDTPICMGGEIHGYVALSGPQIDPELGPPTGQFVAPRI